MTPPAPPVQLAEVVAHLNGSVRNADIPDAPHALNGLQGSNGGTVTRVAAAVDLCEATVRMAAEGGADLLLVHHGLFWGGLEPLTGRRYRRVSGLVEHNIALYSAHLPLHLHPDVGKHAVPSPQLGVPFRGACGEEYGIATGGRGAVHGP